MTTTDGMLLLDPQMWARSGPPHELLTELRHTAPVSRFEIDKVEPFWAITKHANITSISKQPDKFLSGPGITLAPRDADGLDVPGFSEMRVVINMDPPEHRKVRKVASPWFTPRSVKRIDHAVNLSAKQLVDALAANPERQADFATEIAVKHPLRILATALGLPEEQEETILNLSNRIFAPDDEELGGGNTPEDFAKLGAEFVQLFLPIIQNRRDNPTEDLASVLANGQVDGEPMGPMETLGYYLIVFNAGHDTTKNALAGGIRALVENPDQFEMLRRDPSLVPQAVEEILRWTSSVNYMKRTAAEDVVVNGQKIPKGDALVLFYLSGNRDEDVFDDPFRFDITRKPNPHVAFGYGEHFCMGAHFARRSLAAIVRELVTRVEGWELAADPEWIAASFVVGLKRLPVRYQIAS
ncbi:MAG: cytochrome P450 [Deltaproteobacteria bacterium]|nr:cytochrome P450 [Deltaproteobacteria bacterium]MBW2446861.1 cytochrome P450 [Deltaproteobacteria bacterium]